MQFFVRSSLVSDQPTEQALEKELDIHNRRMSPLITCSEDHDTSSFKAREHLELTLGDECIKNTELIIANPFRVSTTKKKRQRLYHRQ
jgi:hypothetical protein